MNEAMEQRVSRAKLKGRLEREMCEIRDSHARVERAYLGLTPDGRGDPPGKMNMLEEDRARCDEQRTREQLKERLALASEACSALIQ